MKMETNGMRELDLPKVKFLHWTIGYVSKKVLELVSCRVFHRFLRRVPTNFHAGHAGMQGDNRVLGSGDFTVNRRKRATPITIASSGSEVLARGDGSARETDGRGRSGEKVTDAKKKKKGHDEIHSKGRESRRHNRSSSGRQNIPQGSMANQILTADGQHRPRRMPAAAVPR